MAELFVVRHGQASFGAEDYDRLSPLGERQGEWLGEYFAERGIAFDRVLAGSMRRQQSTAAAILRGLGASTACEELRGLDEYDFHALYRVASAEYPELQAPAAGSRAIYYAGLKRVLELWSEDRIGGALPETWTSFQRRVAAVREHIQGLGGRRVLVVSSGGIIAAIAQQVLQAPPATAIALNMQIRNTGVCHYYFNARSIRLASFNNLPHLDRPERLDSISYA
jgi:broad specificity phosphatase PhoE